MFLLAPRTLLRWVAMVVLLASLCATFAQAQDTTAKETPQQFAQRTAWWQEAKFGMFIHWGLYCVPADATDLNGNHTIAEWYLTNKQMQLADYVKFADRFNPVKFDAAAWVKTAKDAGMKYIVITSKHHEGFCMFDTKLTDYSIVKATPYKHDPIKDLAEECRKQGLKLCFYYSVMDWHEPDYLPRRPWEGANRPADGADFSRYLDYMKGQLKELLTNYGPIGIIWFDGSWEHGADQLHSAEVNAMLRSLQPGILINNRNQLPEDYDTPEQSIPPSALANGRLWETCMTMNDTWGYAANDPNWKSSEDLIRKLIDIASKGGNFLLNVGPMSTGEFPKESIERLADIGKWMKVNNESIYGTTKSPFSRMDFPGRCTVKGNKLYVHVFTWPKDGGITLPGLAPNTRVESCRALASSQSLKTQVKKAVWDDGRNYVSLSVARPGQIDPVATVVEITLDSAPVAVEPFVVTRPAKDGSLLTAASEAAIHGGANYESGGDRDNIGYWVSPEDYVTWFCDIPAAGRYTVSVCYACPDDTAGSRFSVGIANGPTLRGIVQKTGDWGKFKEFTLGDMWLPAGRQTLEVRPIEIYAGALMNLKSVRLTPVQ